MTKEPEEYGYILRFSILKSNAFKQNQTLKLKPLSFEFSVAVEKSKKTGDLIYWSHFKGLSISSYFTLWKDQALSLLDLIAEKHLMLGKVA